MTDDFARAVRRAYDELAEEYAEQRSAGDRSRAALAALAERLPEDPRVLDAGCGQGDPVLASLPAGAVGLDFSRAQLELAARTGAPLVQGDVRALPFQADAFDGAVALYTLIHVEDQAAALSELARVLSPGGWLLVSEGETRWRGSNPDWLGTGVEMRWDVAGAGRTAADLDAAGFQVAERFDVPDELGDGADPFFLARR